LTKGGNFKGVNKTIENLLRMKSSRVGRMFNNVLKVENKIELKPLILSNPKSNDQQQDTL
jgi:hypothetical protein